MVKQGKKASKGPIVRQQTKAIIVSMILATIGVVSAVYLYQYTNTAKLEQKYNQVQAELEKTNSQLDSTVQDKTQLEQQVQELNKVKQELESQLQAKRQREATLAVLAKQKAQASPNVAYTANCTELRSKLARLGVTGANLDAAITLATRESSCRSSAVNASSGACGEFQSYPCGKWGTPGTDQYLRNAIDYANNRYGSYVNALAHSRANNWY